MRKIHKERLYKKVECKKERVVVFVIDRNVLQNPQNMFTSYYEELDQIPMDSKPVMIPKETIRAFYTLQYIFNRPTVSIVGSRKKAEPKRSLFFSPNDAVNISPDDQVRKNALVQDEAEEEEEDDKEDGSTISSSSEEEAEREFDEFDPGEVLNKIDQYVQEIYNNGVLVGWRFFFIILDPSYEVDRYLEEWFQYHQRSKKYQQSQGLATGFNSQFGYTSKNEWIQQGVTMYTREKFTQQKEALYHELYLAKNPANVHKIFDFAQSCVHLRQMRADSTYLDTESYFPTDDCIVFPTSVFHVSYKFRDPNELMAINWIDLLSDHENATNASFFAGDEEEEEEAFECNMSDDSLNEEERLLARTKRFKPTFCAGNREATETYISKCKKTMSKEEFYVFKSSKQVSDLVFSLLEHDKKINANIFYYKWYKNQRYQNNRWSPFIEGAEDVTPDGNLSLFGNMIRRDIILIERHCKMDHLHQELLLCLHSMLGATDQHGSNRSLHIILSGLPSAGKSYLLDLIYSHFGIDGTIIPRNMTTQGVMSSAHKENGFSNLFDEIPDDFFRTSEKNKVLPMLKSIWSSGKTVTKKTNRKGVVVSVDYENSSPHTLNCNPAYSLVEQGLRSRSSGLFCPGRTRSDGKSYDGTPTLPKDEGFFYEMKLLQFHSAMINLLISIGLMREVDTSHAKAMYEIVALRLNKSGFGLQPRQRSQFLTHCRHVTKYYAIKKIFFSGRPLEGANDFIHYYKVSAFLVTTKEIAWYVMTQLYSPFFSVLQRPFLLAYRELLTIENKPAKNPLYYSLPMKSRHQNELRKEFLETMTLKISSGARIYPSEGNMIDVLWFLEKRQRVDAGAVIKFLPETKSVEIHKDYLNESLRRNAVISAIEACFDKFSPFEVDGVLDERVQEKMYLITGISLRDEPDGKPYESYSLRWVRNSENSIKERNPAFHESIESDEQEYILPVENPDVRLRRERIQAEGLEEFFPEFTFDSMEEEEIVTVVKPKRGNAVSMLQYDGAIVTDSNNDNVYFGTFQSCYNNFHEMENCVQLIDFKMCVSEMDNIDEEETWIINTKDLLR